MKTFPKFILLIAIAIVALLIFQRLNHVSTEPEKSRETSVAITDGPYVFLNEKNNISEIISVCNNDKLSQHNNPENNGIKITDCLDKQIMVQVGQYKTQKAAIEFSINGPIAAISDFHGQYDLMKQILTKNGIIDDSDNWIFNHGHLVITGDVFDRGDKVTEIFWFLYNLEKQAMNKGGMVHLLLGNHETMVLNDDLRYLHPKYLQVEKILGQSYSSLYGDNTLLGQWLRSKNVLVKINDFLFAHGGFHPDLVKKQLSLKTLNQVFTTNLIKAELGKERSELATYLHKTNGPIWYRGYFNEPRASNVDIDSLLDFYQIKHIVVGHTSQPNIQSRYNGKVIAIDSSIKNGEYGEILLIDSKSQMVRGTASGEQLAIIE